jgi:hypothetical protein
MSSGLSSVKSNTSMQTFNSCPMSVGRLGNGSQPLIEPDRSTGASADLLRSSTTNWRAECRRSACSVREEGRRDRRPYLIDRCFPYGTCLQTFRNRLKLEARAPSAVSCRQLRRAVSLQRRGAHANLLTALPANSGRRDRRRRRRSCLREPLIPERHGERRWYEFHRKSRSSGYTRRA